MSSHIRISIRGFRSVFVNMRVDRSATRVYPVDPAVKRKRARIF